MPFALLLLGLAVFAQGTSEFMLSGLVPDIARDLGVSVPAAGALTSAFAAGMVVGAPLVAGLARRWPRRGALLAFLVVFLAVHVVGALTGSFAVLLATRVVGAFANAGFLAVALVAAVGMVPGEGGRRRHQGERQGEGESGAEHRGLHVGAGPCHFGKVRAFAIWTTAAT